MSDKHNWTYWSHLAMLHLNIEDEGNKQRLEIEAKNDFLLTYAVNGSLLNLADPALVMFLKLCGITNPSSPDVELYDVTRGLAKWYYTNVTSMNRKLGADSTEELRRLFDLRGVPGGWDELDRLVRLLAERTLSSIVDNNRSVLIDPEDPGLGCEKPFYAQIFKGITAVMEPNFDLMSYEDQIRMNCGFVASTLQLLMKNVMAYTGQFKHQWVETSECPDYVAVYRGPGRILSFPLKKGGDGERGLEMVYNRIEWRKTGQGLLKDVLSVIPEEAHHKVRGTMFAEELGV